MKNKNTLVIVQWVVCALFAVSAVGIITTSIAWVFYMIFAIAICPKFPQLFEKITKKQCKLSVRVAICVVSLLIAGGIYNSTRSNVKTADSSEDVTETLSTTITVAEAGETTITTVEETTVTTTEEVTTTTEEVTTTTEEETEETTVTTTEVPETESKSNGYQLNTGTLLDVKENGSILVIKVKITGSYSNDATVQQNYHNVENIIKQGGYQYNQIQYWAVADMTDGSEGKVISFTVNKSVIDSVYNGDLVASQLGDYVDELWIHPSLR
jgi:cytoskeletal protein RodZ